MRKTSCDYDEPSARLNGKFPAKKIPEITKSLELLYITDSWAYAKSEG